MTAAVLSTIPMRVRGIVAGFIGGDRPLRDSTSLDALALESLHRIGLAVEIEDVFQISVSDDDAAGWTTIGDLIGTVTRLKGLAA